MGQTYGWREATRQIEAIVAIRAAAGTTSVRSSARGFRFTRDVHRLRLLRNGVEVVPIVPGRWCRKPGRTRSPEHPIGCFALYEFRPEAFEPGAEIEIEIHTEPGPAKPTSWTVPPAVLRAVWADFEPYFQLLAGERR